MKHCFGTSKIKISGSSEIPFHDFAGNTWISIIDREERREMLKKKGEGSRIEKVKKVKSLISRCAKEVKEIHILKLC